MPHDDVRKVMDFLPHRYPFLMIDKVIEFEAGKRLLAVKNVTYNEPQFTGHFPHNPIMPGVLIIEALAQATGLLIEAICKKNKRNIWTFSASATVDGKLVVSADIMCASKESTK